MKRARMLRVKNKITIVGIVIGVLIGVISSQKLF